MALMAKGGPQPALKQAFVRNNHNSGFDQIWICGPPVIRAKPELRAHRRKASPQSIGFSAIPTRQAGLQY